MSVKHAAISVVDKEAKKANEEQEKQRNGRNIIHIEEDVILISRIMNVFD